MQFVHRDREDAGVRARVDEATHRCQHAFTSNWENLCCEGNAAYTSWPKDTSAAMELVLHAHALQEAEKELQQYLIYSGNSQLWDQMLLERNRIQKERKAEEIRLKKIADAKAKEIKQALELAFYCIMVISIVGAVASGTMSYVESLGS